MTLKLNRAILRVYLKCLLFVQVRITRVTDTGVRAPVVAAVAVLRADVGVAGVSQVAAVFHADL